MKKTILIAVALCAAFAFAGYEDWYTPATKFSEQDYGVAFSIGGKTGAIAKPLDASQPAIRIALDKAVSNMELSENAKNAFALAKEALVEAIYVEFLAEKNKQKIDNLGASVETIFQLTNAEKVDSNGAVISSGRLADGVRKKMLAKKNALIGGGGTGGAGSEGGEDKPLQIQVTDFHYDPHEFEQIFMSENSENKSKMGLKGYKDLSPLTTSFPFDKNFGMKKGWIPFSTGYNGTTPNDLTWLAWNGFDTDVLYFLAGTDAEDGKVTLKDWRGGTGGCELNLNGLLTNKDDKDYQDARNSHTFLTRCKNGSNYELHYMAVGDVLDGLSSTPPDNQSVEMHENPEDGTTNLCIYGFVEAKQTRGADDKEPLVPNLPPTSETAGENLTWSKIGSFFADSVFKTSETTGKILLNGTKEGDKKVQVLALQYGETDDDQTLSSFSGDGVSIDLGYTPDGETVESPLAQLHNFDNPERDGAKTEKDFAEILTNVEYETAGWYVPLRTGEGTLQYAPLAKITGIPSAAVDGKTIEVSAAEGEEGGEAGTEMLRIVGSLNASKGQLLKMGDNDTVEWGDFPFDVDCEDEEKDDYPLVLIPSDPEEDEPAKIQMNGWSTFDSPNILYGAYNGEPHSYKFEDVSSLEATEQGTIEIAGYRNASKNALPFKGGSDDTVGWIAPPSANQNGKFLKVTGTGNNATFEWSDAGGGSPVDDASITTNSASGAIAQGKASLHGFLGASAGHVPYKNNSGKLSWKEVSDPDNDSVAKNSDGKLEVKGFKNAAYDSTPVKDSDGNLSWVIATSNTIDVVVRVEYDTDAHQLFYYTKKITFLGSVSEEEEQGEVFTATELVLP